jgi:hypothetical protein
MPAGRHFLRILVPQRSRAGAARLELAGVLHKAGGVSAAMDYLKIARGSASLVR